MMESSHHAKARCFFKIILCEITSNSKLMIPEKFVRKYGEELQGGVLLKAPGAPAWSVDVQRTEGKVWLRNGWPNFAKFYSLRFGHFVLFEYQGNCNFKVVIFDTSTTEIDYPLLFEERSGIEEIRVSKKKQVHYDCNGACHVGNSLKRKLQKEKIAEASSESWSSDEEYRDIEKPSHANGTQHDTDRMKKPIKLEADLDISMQQHVMRAKGVRSSTTTEEKDRALAYAEAFKSSYPSFKVVMQPTYVGKTGGLHVKRACLQSYARKGIDVLILRIGGRSWLVKCSVYSRRIRLGCGWKQFAEDNALAVGDVCVFELVKPSKKLLDVVIYRAAAAAKEEHVN